MLYESDHVVEMIARTLQTRASLLDLAIYSRCIDFQIHFRYNLTNDPLIVETTFYFGINSKLFKMPSLFSSHSDAKAFVLRTNELRYLVHLLEVAYIKKISTEALFLLCSLSSGMSVPEGVETICLYNSLKGSFPVKNVRASYYIDVSQTDPISAIKASYKYKHSSSNNLMSLAIRNYNDFFEGKVRNESLEIIRPYIKHMIAETLWAFQEMIIDPFDLELQSLISATLYNSKELFVREQHSIKVNTALIKQLVEDQKEVILDRYTRFNHLIPIEALFVPKGIFQQKTRYWFTADKLFAVPIAPNGSVDKGRAIEIEFRPVDLDIALIYEECFHYIHTPRAMDLAFGLFIKGERFPFAISTLELVGERIYKRSFLQQAGIDPARCMDEIRLYSFRWAPVMTSSLLSNLIRQFLKTNHPNITTTITAVNRNLFTGKYIHEAGYIPIALKPAKFSFEKIILQGREILYYQGTSQNLVANSVMPLLPTVEYYRHVYEITKPNLPDGKVFIITEEQYAYGAS